MNKTDSLPEAPLVIRQIAHEHAKKLFELSDNEKNEIIATQYKTIFDLRRLLRVSFLAISVCLVGLAAMIYTNYQLQENQITTVYMAPAEK